MRRKGDPTRIGRLIADIVARRGLGGAIPLTAVRTGFARVVGAELARRTRVVGLRGGVATVETDSAALAYELESFAARKLLEELRRQPGAEFVSNLRFRAGASRSGASLNDG
jgi:predicted nucleic acid-binding Zn ribbon protein